MDDFRQLRQLIALAECGNLGLAAARLGITKSAVSQTLKRLEDLYGVQLFVRDHRGVRPTPFGDLLVDTAKRGLDMFRQTQREFDLMRSLQRGRLIVGCDPAIVDSLLARALADLIVAYPKLRFSIKCGTWAEMKDDLDNRSIDLFVGVAPDLAITGYSTREFILPGIVVYCRPGHPLTRRKIVTFADCYEFPVLGPQLPDWCFQQIFDTSADKTLTMGQIRDVWLVSGSMGAIREIVKNSDALSGECTGALDDEVAAGLLHILDIRDDRVGRHITCVAVSEERRVMSPLAQKLMEALLSRAAAMIRRAGLG